MRVLLVEDDAMIGGSVTDRIGGRLSLDASDPATGLGLTVEVRIPLRASGP